MHKYLTVAGVVTCFALGGCDSGDPPTPLAPAAGPELLMAEPIIDEGGGGGFTDPGGDTGGGGGSTGGSAMTTQYRLVGQVYPIEVVRGSATWGGSTKMRGWSRFEKLVGSSWEKVDASYLALQCFGGGAYDSDSENNAGFTDVEFWIGPAPPGTTYLVQCNHQATHAGVSYTATSSYYAQIF